MFKLKVNIYKKKLIVDIFSDLFSIIGYLVYLEIIEINFWEFNYNIRKNIIIRGKSEIIRTDSNSILMSKDDDENSNDDKSDNSKSESSEIYWY